MSFLSFETLVKVTCCNCGVLFGMSEGTNRQRLSDGKDFYCPNGHIQHYTENDAARLAKARKQIDDLTARNQQLAYGQRKVETQLKGTKTRMRNLKARVANGVCPCCQRQFGNLRRHMEHKHPQYKSTLPDNG